MHAHDRFLPDWFSRVRSRQITLPRFQRFVAWGHSEVSALLTSVVRGLPSGAALILEVGEEEKFTSRTIVDAPEGSERVNEQLLDGQQRVTALWRSMHDTYEDRTYLIGFEEAFEGDEEMIPFVYGQARWIRGDRRYPVWVDDPVRCWRRGLIPISLLRPGDIQGEIDTWIEKTLPDDLGNKYSAYKELSQKIGELRTKVREFNLPYLSLPATTSKEVALDVFIKMNTSSVQLSTYDIVVALVEGETGKSLHEHVEELDKRVPRASSYADLPGLILDVVALMQNRMPSTAGYRGIDYTRMLSEWNSVVSGIRFMVSFLEDEGVFDGQRLPSYTAIPILAALREHFPSLPDQMGNARVLLRKFLWRAFLTSRYEQSSATNALQDYRGIREVLTGHGSEDNIPVFNEEFYPPLTPELIMHADWPKRKSILSRGLLGLMLKAGAKDLADGTPANVNSITNKVHPREYHHLFPASILEDAGVPDDNINRALNCALITWRTNRTISNKDPIAYLKERSDNSLLGQPELRHRLKTHLIPFPQLAVGYGGLTDNERRSRVNSDYIAFLQARAELMVSASRTVFEGRPMVLEDLFTNDE